MLCCYTALAKTIIQAKRLRLEIDNKILDEIDIKIQTQSNKQTSGDSLHSDFVCIWSKLGQWYAICDDMHFAV